jgi:hypothetical protein
MVINDNIIREAHKYLDNHRRRAFKNPILFSNNSFDKNPFLRNSTIVNDLLLNNFPLFKIMSRCILLPVYYIKNIIYIFNIIILYALYKKKYTIYKSKPVNFEIVIDTFATDYKNPFNEKYFIDLYNELDINKKKYCIILKETYKKNLFKYYIGIGKALKSDYNTVIDFLELDIKEIIALFFSIFLLPFYSFLYALKNIKFNKKDIYFSFHLISSLSNADFTPYLRYLFAHSYFSKKNKKIIMWCEFQAKDIAFIKGIRETRINHIIHATQFFFKPENVLKFHLTDNDKEIDIHPDYIHVLCKNYVLNEDYINGPAYRYQHLFKNVDNIKTNDILIALPYFIDDSKYVLDFLQNCTFLHNKQIPLKLHPDSLKLVKYYQNVIDKFKLIDNIESNEFFKIVISTGTGLMVENLIKGSKILLIEKNYGITTNPIPKNISEEKYKVVNSTYELEKIINNLLKKENLNIAKINSTIIKKIEPLDTLKYFKI